MFIKGLKWLDARLEMTKINNEWAKIMMATQKYQWKPEFLWSKEEVKEVIELMEKAYELLNEEFRIYLICKAYDKIPVVTDSMNQLDSELWTLKQRLTA